MTCGDGPVLFSMTERCSSNLCLRCLGDFFFFFFPLSNKQKVDGNDTSAAKMGVSVGWNICGSFETFAEINYAGQRGKTSNFMNSISGRKRPL